MFRRRAIEQLLSATTMIVLRFSCIALAIFFAIVALSSGILAIWLNLLDLHYAASILLTAAGLFCGVMAFGMWKLARRAHRSECMIFPSFAGRVQLNCSAAKRQRPRSRRTEFPSLLSTRQNHSSSAPLAGRGVFPIKPLQASQPFLFLTPFLNLLLARLKKLPFLHRVKNYRLPLVHPVPKTHPIAKR
jgi:hypothetical protein